MRTYKLMNCCSYPLALSGCVLRCLNHKIAIATISTCDEHAQFESAEQNRNPKQHLKYLLNVSVEIATENEVIRFAAISNR